MRKGGVPVTKNMYTVAGDGPCNEELALRIQAGDKNAAERLVAQNEGYLTKLARASRRYFSIAAGLFSFSRRCFSKAYSSFMKLSSVS